MPSSFDTGPVAVVTFTASIVLFGIDFRLVVRINVNNQMCYYLRLPTFQQITRMTHNPLLTNNPRYSYDCICLIVVFAGIRVIDCKPFFFKAYL